MNHILKCVSSLRIWQPVIFDYFENRAFSDGNIQKGCYCVWHHWTEKHEHERSLMPEHERPYRKRDYAKELIEKGVLNGFVASLKIE